MCSISTSNSGSRLVPSGTCAVGRLGGAGHAGATGCVQRRQAQRVLGGFGGFVVEVGRDVEQQVVAGFDDLGDARVGPVRLVDDENHRKVRGQRLAQHEPGLRQRTLGRVDQQQHPVHHRQPALHLAAEVGVPGGVDDVDHRHRPVRVMAVHGGVLGQDGDALFPLQVAAVHHAFLQSSPRSCSAPDCRSIASTSVVLPWSTCATMATLRNGTSVIVAAGACQRRTEANRAAHPPRVCRLRASALVGLVAAAAFGCIHRAVGDGNELFDGMAPIGCAQQVQFGASGADAGRYAGRMPGDRTADP